MLDPTDRHAMAAPGNDWGQLHQHLPRASKAENQAWNSARCFQQRGAECFCQPSLRWSHRGTGV